MHDLKWFVFLFSVSCFSDIKTRTYSFEDIFKVELVIYTHIYNTLKFLPCRKGFTKFSTNYRSHDKKWWINYFEKLFVYWLHFKKYYMYVHKFCLYEIVRNYHL